jgi:hypothetical protein
LTRVLGRARLADAYGFISADSGSVLVSCACILHCVALPLASSVLPLGGLWTQDDLLFHRILVGVALPLSSLGLWRGLRRHGDRRVVGTGLLGLLLLVVASAARHDWLSESAERIAVVFASLALAGAHLWNARSCRRCSGC